MHAIRLAVQGIRWRLGASLAVFAVCAVTVAVAVVGPLYGRAAEDSLLRDRVRAASVDETGVALTRSSQQGAIAPEQLLQSVTRTADDPRLAGYFGPARLGLRTGPDTDVTAAAPGERPGTRPEPVRARVAWRDGFCAQLRFLAGRCPAAPGEVAVAARTPDDLRMPLGATVRFELGGDVIGAGAVPFRLRVVGRYEPVDERSPYWFGRDYFDAAAPRGDEAPRVDTLFVDRETLVASGTSGLFADAERPLLVDRVRLRDVPRLASLLRARQIELSNSSELVAQTAPFVDLARALQDERSVVRSGALLVSAQLVVLAWFVLFLVVAAVTEERADEIALAKLRGLAPGAVASFGLLEPLLLLVAAVPVGVLAAFGGVRLLADAVLLRGTEVRPDGYAVAAVLAAVLGGALAATLAARALLTRPVAEQLRAAAPAGTGRRAVVVEAVVTVLAAAGAYQLVLAARRGSGSGDALALLTPGLVGLAAGLLAARLLPLLGRPLLRATRGSPRLGAFLAVRQLLRRPGTTRLVVLVTAATALSVFAVDAYVVAARNRANAARQQVGAAQVVPVGDANALQTLEAVRRADPSGRTAMAAAELIPTAAAGTTRVLAVDTTRLAAVAAWVPQWSGRDVEALAKDLRPASPGPVVLTGTTVSATVDGARLPAGRRLYLEVRVRTDARDVDVRLGPLSRGVATYRAAAPGCRSGCRLERLAVQRALGDFSAIVGAVDVQSLTADRGPGAAESRARLADTATWTVPRDNLAAPLEDLPARVRPARGALRIEFATTSSEVPSVVPLDAPRLLPVVVPRRAEPPPYPGDPDARLGTGLDGAQQLVRVVDTSSVLPRSGYVGALTDLEYAERSAAGAISTAQPQVWLASDDDAANAVVLRRLRDAGLQLGTPERLADRLARLDRGAPALALALFLVAALAGVVLLVATLVTMLFVGGRNRTYDLAAARAVGVPARALRGSVSGEQLLLLGIGAAVGAVAGLAGAALALPAFPVLGSGPAAPPLVLDPGWAALAALVAALLAAGVVVAVVAGRLLVAAAGPDRLREARA